MVHGLTKSGSLHLPRYVFQLSKRFSSHTNQFLLRVSAIAYEFERGSSYNMSGSYVLNRTAMPLAANNIAADASTRRKIIVRPCAMTIKVVYGDKPIRTASTVRACSPESFSASQADVDVAADLPPCCLFATRVSTSASNKGERGLC